MKTSFKKTIIATSIALVLSPSVFAVTAKTVGGLNHNLFVTDTASNTGVVFGSGNNRFNQLGAAPSKVTVYTDGKFINPTGVYDHTADAVYKVAINVGVTNVKTVAASGNRSAALKTDGTVYVWGQLSNFVNGAPSEAYMSTIPQALDITGVIDIAIAGTKIIMLKEGSVKGQGVVWEWEFRPGSKPYIRDSMLPNQDIVSIAAQSRFAPHTNTPDTGTNSVILEHFMALDASGNVFVWGDNDNGELGLGDLVRRPLGVPLSFPERVKSIAVSSVSSFVVTESGDVYQSGIVGKNQYTTMTKVENAFGVQEVSATVSGAYGLTDSGTVIAWGDHSYIGAGGNLSSPSAIQIPELGNTVDFIGTGNKTFTTHSTDGKFNTIGYNKYGQISDVSYLDKHSFPSISIVDPVTAGSWVDPQALAVKQCLETALNSTDCTMNAADSINKLEDQLAAANSAKQEVQSQYDSLNQTYLVNQTLLNTANGTISDDQTKLASCTADLTTTKSSLQESQAKENNSNKDKLAKESASMLKAPVTKVVAKVVPVAKVAPKIVVAKK